MKNCVYYAENEKIPEAGASLKTGYGFTPEGFWRDRSLPTEEAGILIDDRFLPCKAGLAAARRALEDWHGLVVLDFERPRIASLAELARGLADKNPVLSPAYGDLPHGAILVGPWQGERDFFRWLSCQQKRFGEIVLDACPLRTRCCPGGRGSPWTGALPQRSHPCAGLGCLHCRLPDGSILFWDTKQTLTARLERTNVPLILFRSDWDLLPD